VVAAGASGTQHQPRRLVFNQLKRTGANSLKRVVNTTPVTISLPVELIERARAAGINVSQACRAGLQDRLLGEAVSPPELIRRVAQLEQQVRELLAWRNRVKE
jgi:hypothetical protein